MNIKRGLIRVWVVISFLWAVVFLVIDGPGAVSNIKTIVTPYQREEVTTRFSRELERRGEESIGEMRYRANHKIARWQLLNFWLGLVVFPALFWALLYAGFWITRGSRASNEPIQ